MKDDQSPAALGLALRSIREERSWSLAELAAATGWSISTLSKVENGHRSLTYDKLVHLAHALSIDISRLFTTAQPGPPTSLFTGRRSVQRYGEGFQVNAGVYTYRYLAHDLVHKRFTPVIMDIHAKSIDDFEQLLRHEGDELAFVVVGEVEVHTEIYKPLRLKTGESVFFDSSVGHAYISVGDESARILCIGCDAEPKSGENIIPFVKEAIEAEANEVDKTTRILSQDRGA